MQGRSTAIRGSTARRKYIYSLKRINEIYFEYDTIIINLQYWTNKTTEDALANPPHGVQLLDWWKVVQHWGSDETGARASINARIRERAPPRTHVLGRSTIDQL